MEKVDKNAMSKILDELAKKIIDFSARNNLVNFNHTATRTNFIRVIDEDYGFLFNSLNDGALIFKPLPGLDKEPPDEQSKDFKDKYDELLKADELHAKLLYNDSGEGDSDAEIIRSIRRIKDIARHQLGLTPRAKSSKDLSDLKNHAKNHDFNPSYELSANNSKTKAHTDKYIQTLFPTDELNRRLSRIHSIMNREINDRGVNPIYLVFGFLNWTDQKGKDLTSPLITYQINLKKEKVSKGYLFKISTDQDPTVNPVLAEKLNQDYGIVLPDINPEELNDEFSLKKFFNKLSKLFSDKPNWKIKTYVTMTPLKSSSISIHNDYNPDNWENQDIYSHENSAILLGGLPSRECGRISEKIDIEQQLINGEASDIFLETDSSQHNAVEKILQGDPLIIQGPPGTGKSQTIANAIANLATKGKKVLFVAEKATAITQISKNLTKIGFDPLLFEAHSEINKEQLYKALDKRLNLSITHNEKTFKRKIKSLKGQLSESREYKKFLTKRSTFPNINSGGNDDENLNYFECIGKYLKLKYLIKDNNIPYKDVVLDAINFTNSDYKDLEDLVNRIYNYGELKDLEILKIKTNDPSEITVNSFKNETEKCIQKFEGLNNLMPFESFDGCIRDTVSYIMENDIQCFNDIDLLNNEHLEIKLAKKISTFKNKFNEIEPSLIRDAEGALANLKLTSISLIPLKEIINELPHLINNTQFVNDLVNIGKSSASKEIETKDSFEFLDSLSKINANYLNNTYKNLRLEEDFNPEDFNSFKDKIKEIRNLVGQMVPKINQERMNVFIDFISKNKSELLNEYKTIFDHHKNNFFRFLYPSYREIKNALSILEIDVTKIDASIKIDKLLEISAVRDEISDTTIPQITGNLYDLLKLSPQKVDKLENDLIEPIRKLITDSQKHKFSLFKIVNHYINCSQRPPSNTSNYLHKYYNEKNKIVISKFLDQLKIQLNDYRKIRELYSNLDYKKTNYDIWQFDEYCKEIPKLIEESNAPSLQNLKKHDGRYSLTKLFCFADEIFEKYDDINNKYSILSEKIIQTNDIVEKINLKEGKSNLLHNENFWSQINDVEESVDYIFNYIKNNFIKHFHSSKLNSSTYNIIKDFSKLESSKISTMIHQKCIYLDIEKSKFKQLLEEAKPSICKNKDDYLILLQYHLVYNYLKGDSFISKNQILTKFDSLTLSNNKNEIKKLSNDLKSLYAQKGLHDACNVLIPRGNDKGLKSTYTEKKLINNEIKKKTRKLGHRQLIKRAYKALSAMKPVWLMLPQNVSDYIPRKMDLFDVLIIDEASQMFPESAIPSILRSKQLVVVGDNKQMPPTNYFKYGDGCEEEEEEIDSESILDLCSEKLGKTVSLDYHYRSEHPDLINFSNHHFYDDRLNVVYSPILSKEGYGVRNVYVDGEYLSESNKGTNLIEADEVINLVKECIEDYPKRSIAVVTINQAQRDLIQQKWDNLCSDPAEDKIRDYCDFWSNEKNKSENFKIINLERVQGDERDTIIISTVYGKDKSGKVMQRFGPINQKAGHRRLNVLFTRAKKLLYLVTSLKSSDIKSPEGSEGKVILQKYLHYSLNPSKNLITGNSTGTPDSDFEVFVADKIRSCGYDLDYQIGVKGFKIDIGIKDPRDKNEYIAGIECDGATYHSSPEARDRDIIRQEILEHYGWKIYRIWSTSWFQDPDSEIEKLINWLKEIHDPIPKGNFKDIENSENIRYYTNGEIWKGPEFIGKIEKKEIIEDYFQGMQMSKNYNVENQKRIFYEFLDSKSQKTNSFNTLIEAEQFLSNNY